MNILCVLSHHAYGKPERGENYDYVYFLPALRRLGHNVEFFDTGDRSRYGDFAALNVALLERVVASRPDVIFCVLMHYEIWFDTLDLIRAASPALILNWGTDDSWKFAQASRFFAEHVDLHVTTDLASAEAARSLGLTNVLLSQWAASDADLADPARSGECRYDVSFVGSMYGYRADWIEVLRSVGIRVSCFGHGTENGVVEASEIPWIYRNSRISLNFSGSGQGAGGEVDARQIKARTFEVPGAGGFLLTETTPGIERYFAVDREIAMFDSPEELVAKSRYYLDHPDVRDNVARAGHDRTKADHTYAKRFSIVLERLATMGTGTGRTAQPWQLSVDALSDAVRRYRRNGITTWIRALLIAPLTLIFGPQRGPRAARRLVFELSWRIGGAATYGAGGLPGRLFYTES